MRALRLLRLAKLFRMVIPAIQEFRELNQGRTFRQQVYSLLHPTDTSGKLHDMLDSFVVWWVLISVVAVVLESIESVHYVLNVHFIVIDAVAVFIFSMEYIFRLYSCPEGPEFKGWFGRVRYARQPIVMIDLLAIVPFFLESLLHHLFDLRFLRIFRLMRLLKLTRYTTSTGTLVKALKREWPVIAASTFIMLLLVVLTASMGYLFEHAAQPDKFENIPQSIYWAVVTLASVGYGDISPVTPVGRLMTIIMALVGIGIFAVPAAVLSTAFNDQLHKDREMLHEELIEFLQDGDLSEDEFAQIMRKAEELHISQDEVLLLIEKVKREAEDRLQGHLPLDAIAKTPEIAFEQFRTAIGNLRQILAAGDTAKMQQLFETPGRATDSEKAIFDHLHRP
jgi:voltage-gated potassium channel Kch